MCDMTQSMKRENNQTNKHIGAGSAATGIASAPYGYWVGERMKRELENKFNEDCSNEIGREKRRCV